MEFAVVAFAINSVGAIVMTKRVVIIVGFDFLLSGSAVKKITGQPNYSGDGQKANDAEFNVATIHVWFNFP